MSLVSWLKQNTAIMLHVLFPSGVDKNKHRSVQHKSSYITTSMHKYVDTRIHIEITIHKHWNNSYQLPPIQHGKNTLTNLHHPLFVIIVITMNIINSNNITMITIIFIINTLALPKRHSHSHGHHFEALQFLNSPLVKSIEWNQSGSSSPLSNFFRTRTLYILKNTCPSFQSLPKKSQKITPHAPKIH